MKECSHKTIREMLNAIITGINTKEMFPDCRCDAIRDINAVADLCLNEREDSKTFRATFKTVFGQMVRFQSFCIGGPFEYNIADYNC